MNFQNFLENFKGLFDDTDSSEFYEEKKFRELSEWDSLTALSLIAMTDELYSIKLNGEDIRNSETINDLYKIIEKKYVNGN
jgi:acyl carrier protein